MLALRIIISKSIIKNLLYDQKSPLVVKDNQKFYFDIHTQLKGPSSAYVSKNNKDENYNALPLKTALEDKNDPNIGKTGLSDAKKSKQRLVIHDSLDPRLELAGNGKDGGIKIYYSKEWNDKTLSSKKGKEDASKYFYIHHAKDKQGHTVVDAVMKPDAAKVNSDAWWKDYHLVIPVKLKKDAQPSNGNKSGGWLQIDNIARIPSGGGNPRTWVKIKFTHETVKEDGKPGVDSKKTVYGADLADPDKLGKALSYGTNDNF